MPAKLLPLLGLALALAACAATGPRYSDYIATLPAVAPRATRITVFRTAESLPYHGASATVKVDGAERAGCDFAGYQTFHVPAGHHVLSVTLWGEPGACSLSVDLLGGEEYFYEISPRGENLAAGFVGSLLGAFGRLPLALGPSLVAGAESAGRACGGAFAMVRVDEAVARRKLEELRLSK